MKRRILAVGLIGAMALSLLSGCGGKQDAAMTSADVVSVIESGEMKDVELPLKEPITLKVMIGIRSTDSIIPPNDMKVVQDLEAKTGIHVEWETVKAEDWDTKFNLAMASGEYPDVIIQRYRPVDYEEYGVTQGILLPLDELIDRYVPNYAERRDAEDLDPTLSLKASDGKHYAMGMLRSEGNKTQGLLFLNHEWLNALGLSEPQTLDELTDVLRAFKTGDPNGNGIADEVPVEFALNTRDNDPANFLPMFGIPYNSTKFLYIDDDKQVKLIPVQEGFRQCLEWFHTLYTEELLGPDVLSQDMNTFNTKLSEGNVGFFPAFRLTIAGYDDGVEKSCKIMLPTPPEGVTAKSYDMLELCQGGVYIPKTNQHIPETMAWLNAIYDTETQYSLYYGQEGEGWEWTEDGKVKLLVTNMSENKSYIDSNAPHFATSKYAEENLVMPVQAVEKKEYTDLYMEKGIFQKYSNDYLNLVGLNSDQKASVVLIETDIKNAVKESYADFIVNGVTDERWNAFVQKFSDMKADEYVKMYQDALDAMDFE